MSARAALCQWSRAVLLLAVGAAPAGCLRATAVDTAVQESSRARPWTHFFLFGTIGEADVDVRLSCPGPAARVQTYDDALTLTLSLASLGIYTPRRVEILCGPPRIRGSEP